MSAILKVTDKKDTKTLPCRDCGAPLACNKFESKTRAHCHGHIECPNPEKQGSWAAGRGYLNSRGLPRNQEVKIDSDTESDPDIEEIDFNSSVSEIKYPQAMANADCPMCCSPMILASIQENMGVAAFKCNECRTTVEIRCDWSYMLVHRVPSPKWKKIMKEFNETQTSFGSVSGWNAV